MNDAELDRYSKEVRLSRRASCEALLKAREQQPVRSVRSLADSAYHVGAIPVSEGVTPAGARTYSIPIAVAPDLKLTPSISLTYNSLSGNGIAGYGWDIAGIPCISLSKKTAYYDGTMSDCLYTDSTAVYSLDGVRIVQRSSHNGFPDYTLETSSGHILVRRHINAAGRTLFFSALYPDGSRATFGNQSSQDGNNMYPLTRLEDKEGNLIV